MNSVFSEQILADKLSKLNSTQQCVESILPDWLRADFSELKNSKHTGTEFVSEFWKVLPAALKDVLENGDEHGKNAVSRLVDIWDQRRVFGSRARGLKELMLGSEPPPTLELNKKRSRGSVRIIRRDSRSVKIKLSMGGTAEKIISALHNVLSEHSKEESDLNKCKAAVRHAAKLEKDVESVCNHDGDPRRGSLANELQDEEASLKECVEKLKLIESNHAVLMFHLKEALQEQESNLENVRTQLQLAQAMVEEAANMRKRLKNEPIVMPNKPLSAADSPKPDSVGPPAKISEKTAAAIAAEVADKLTASTHSQQIMTSVLSTFAAEEAKNADLATSTNPSNSLPIATSDRRMISEKPLPISDTTATAFVPVQQIVVSTPHQPQAVLVRQSPVQSQASAAQTQYNMYPVSTQQYLQPSGGVMIGLPYTFSTPPTPPPPVPQVINLARSSSPLVQQQQPMALIQQPTAAAAPPLLTMNQPMLINQQPPQYALQQPAPRRYFAPEENQIAKSFLFPMRTFTVDIGIEDMLKRRHWDLSERCDQVNSSIVDEHIDLAKLIQGVCHNPPDAVLRNDIQFLEEEPRIVLKALH
ncbi:hypothetical protein MUK42_34575 [Musa troglodytarum]|uniref:CID domain-containing protein n=1 Tax=Musa troglodytarum TaxID=320322 RepID=A0A9E7KX47_9LILI|nr:hypothetical protein MUK42_34575 [Musa troglodytarum]